MAGITLRIYGSIIFAGLIAAGGCLPRNGTMDLLQARLRQNEQQLAELQSELQTSQTDLKQARRELDSLRTEFAESGRSHLTPEQASALVQVTRIALQPWLTGGVAQDDEPGDDALVLQFAPQDDQGESVKLPGQVRITLSDPGGEPGQQTLGEWAFTPEECRENWIRGWTGGAFQFTLPWQEPPASSRLAVHVVFETPDGRSFEDTALVKVNPSPEALARRHPSSQYTPPPPLDDPERNEPVHQVSRSQSVRKAPVEKAGEPQFPHSVNWRDGEIPVLR
jgi:hypothetical protein